MPSPPSACRQFFIDPAAMKQRPSYVGNLDAVVVAQRFELPTLNGYSGGAPKGVHFVEFDDPSYLANVADWAYAHNLLSGLCILDLHNKSWRVMAERLSSIRAVLIGSNLLDLESLSDPMAVFAFFRVGFQEAEPGGQWTMGDARLVFSMPMDGVKSVVVSGHKGYSGQAISVSVGDRKIAIDPADYEFHVEIPVTQPVSQIDFSANSFVPSATGINPDDPRQLGAFLWSVVLKN